MLYDVDVSTILPRRDMVLRAMHQSDFRFYLTGSRRFGTHKSDSDYDFFVELEPTNYRQSAPSLVWLRNQGFHPLTKMEAGYLCSQSLVVYRHSTGIDVQAVRKASVKLSAQNILLKEVGAQMPNSKERREAARLLWEAAYTGQPARVRIEKALQGLENLGKGLHHSNDRVALALKTLTIRREVELLDPGF